MLVTVFDPGARTRPAHAHDHGEETCYVVSGTGSVKVGEQSFALEPGVLFFVPQGMPHMVWNTGSVPLKLICFYAPEQSALEYTYYDTFDFDQFKK